MAAQEQLSAELRARIALEKHRFQNSHSLGQNFILDGGLIDRLVEEARVAGGDNVLEIGPGAGVMTDALALRAGKVLAVEVDNRLEPVLRDVLASRDNVQLLFQDFMKADLADMIDRAFGDGEYRVIANLPYYITSDILLRLVTARRRPRCIHIMVQKEAAERIMSRPDTKPWCAMAATVQTYGVPEVLLELPPEAFDPPPHVTSCFMRITRHETPVVTPRDEETYLKLINAAFAMRRKTLANNLKAGFGLSQQDAAKVLESAGVDVRVRGEALSLEALCRVADAIHALRAGEN